MTSAPSSGERIRAGDSHIVVGTRSAIFAPVPDLALIVVDEEHDHSYKQEEMPRYHARDVAVMRAKMSQAAVVLGSATPSLETYYNATQGEYRLLELPERIEKRPLPEVEILDMREEFQRTKKDDALSRKLVEEIGQRLERHEQVMVLLNRRGYSAFVLCRECGESVQCKNCAISLTYHKREHRLVCHYCGYHAARAQDLSQVRQRVRAISRHRFGEAGAHPAWDVSAGAHRATGPRHGARPRRFGAYVDRTAVPAKSICWWERR